MPKSGPPPRPIPAAWNTPICEYLEFLAASGRPPTTIATRRSHLARIARELGGSPADATDKRVKRWFASQQPNWKRETHRGYRNSAVSFFRWAAEHGYGIDPATTALPTVTADVPVPRPAPERVVKVARMAADARVTLMLRLAVEAGLRRAEIAQVHVNDLREGFDGPQLLVHGKGSRERLLPITDDLADHIGAGAAGHTPGASSTGWLFPGDDGGHLSPRWVGTLCSRVMPGVWTLHTLRHRFATNAYRGTRNIRAVQQLLGHTSLDVTQRYTATDDQEMRAAMNAAAIAS